MARPPINNNSNSGQLDGSSGSFGSGSPPRKKPLLQEKISADNDGDAISSGRREQETLGAGSARPDADLAARFEISRFSIRAPRSRKRRFLDRQIRALYHKRENEG